MKIARLVSFRRLVFLGVLTAGCASSPPIEQMYPGPARELRAVVLLRDGCKGPNGVEVLVLKVDGQPARDVCGEKALLPGPHHLEVAGRREVTKEGVTYYEPPQVNVGGTASPGGFKTTPPKTQEVWQSPGTLDVECAGGPGETLVLQASVSLDGSWSVSCKRVGPPGPSR
jgi:hypothetical protein